MDGFLNWLEPWVDAFLTVILIAAVVGALLGVGVLIMRFSERMDARRRKKQGPILPPEFRKPKRPGT